MDSKQLNEDPTVLSNIVTSNCDSSKIYGDPRFKGNKKAEAAPTYLRERTYKDYREKTGDEGFYQDSEEEKKPSYIGTSSTEKGKRSYKQTSPMGAHQKSSKKVKTESPTRSSTRYIARTETSPEDKGTTPEWAKSLVLQISSQISDIGKRVSNLENKGSEGKVKKEIKEQLGLVSKEAVTEDEGNIGKTDEDVDQPHKSENSDDSDDDDDEENNGIE
jgi:hypothetical protein